MANEILIAVKGDTGDVMRSLRSIKTDAQEAGDHGAAGMRRIGDGAEQAHGPVGKLAGVFGDVAKIAGGFVVAQGLMQIPSMIGGAVNAASDLNESLSKVQVVFRDGAPEIEAWANTAAGAMGLSKGAALEAAGTFGNFLQAMGQTPAAAKDMSIGMVQLAADLASFNNANPDEVLLALRSGLSGEAEPMRKFGVALSEAAVASKAAQMGIAPLGGTLTEQQKIAARYAIIMDQTTTAQGDFARTSTGAANQQRILAAQTANLSAEIGGKLLPAKIALQRLLIEKLLPALSQGVTYFGTFLEVVTDLGSAAWDKISGPLETLAGLAWDALKDGATALIDLAMVAWDGLKAGAEIVMQIVAANWDGVKDGAASLAGLAETQFGQLKEDLGGVQDAVGGIDLDSFASGWDRIKGAVQPVIDVLRPLVERILKDLKDSFAQQAAALGPLIGALGNLVSAFAPLEPIVRPIAELFGVVIVAMIALFLAQLDLVIKAVTIALVGAINIATASINILATAISGIATVLTAWIPTIAGLAGDFVKAMGKIGQQMVAGMASALSGGWADIRDAIWAMKDAAIKGLGKVTDWLVDVGWDLIRGVASGITAAKGLIQKALQSIWNELPDWARKALEIFSPSRVMAREVGMPIAAGVAAGIVAGIPLIQDALQQVTQTVTGWDPGTPGGGGGGGGGTWDPQKPGTWTGGGEGGGWGGGGGTPLNPNSGGGGWWTWIDGGTGERIASIRISDALKLGFHSMEEWLASEMAKRAGGSGGSGSHSGWGGEGSGGGVLGGGGASAGLPATYNITINALDARGAADAVLQTMVQLERTGRITKVTAG